MIVRIATVRFVGSGSIDCRICQHRTVFPDDTQAIIVTDSWEPTSLPFGNRQIIRSATDLSTLHRCGLEYYWQCPQCGDEGISRYFKGRLIAVCRLCRINLVQKVRPPVVDTPVD